MNKGRHAIFYFGTLLLFALAIFVLVEKGNELEQYKQVKHTALNVSLESIASLPFAENLHHPFAHALIQIVVIIAVSRIFGWLFKRIHQPKVIGEIVAGIVLGPSLLGLFFPEVSAWLFPAESLGSLKFLSQIGLLLFMVVIGMELDISTVFKKAQNAVIISHASIVFPFASGMALAYFMYRDFAPANIQFLSFGLFLGIAMSITAFPVLARIVQERGMNKTPLGAMVLTCAAADDVTAWCILAVVIAIVKAGSLMSAVVTILAAIVYVLFMLVVVRKILAKVGEKYAHRTSLNKAMVATFFLTLLLSSLAAEVIGIHSLFGAFMAGMVLPDSMKTKQKLVDKVEDISIVLLLPLFFVFTGLRTQIGLLNEAHLWKICLWVIAVAVAGKFLGSALAAKFVGQSWRDSLSIGALMNTRGLMELVVLNIGYEIGVLSPQVFAMFVMMALATTFMTGPALWLIGKLFKY